MSLYFKEEGHLYKSVDPKDAIEWTSVTTLIGKFKNKFDAVAISRKVVKKKDSKWYGMNPKEVQRIWKKESTRSTDIGTLYHNNEEDKTLANVSLNIEGSDIPVIKPILKDDLKYAPNQKLEDGVYPEFFAYLKSAGVCGQVDKLTVVNGKIDILDFKTNKSLEFNSFVDWEGKSKMMTGPLSHIEDCNMNHYNLQMSIYLYIVLRHNPHLKPGELVIRHVLFEIESEDEWGYPVIKMGEDGLPVIKEEVDHVLPYMKDDVINLIKYFKKNK